MKMRSVGDELFHDEFNIAYRNYATAPKQQTEKRESTVPEKFQLLFVVC
jgi:hypothetical protein